MTYLVKRIDRNSAEFREILAALWAGTRRQSSGRNLAMKAMLGKEDSRLVVAFFSTGKPAGAANYRIQGGKLKRINTGVLQPRRGIGSALVRFMVRENPGLPVWSKNLKRAVGWCRRLGMRRGKRSGNLTFHHWTAKQAASWASTNSQ